MNNAVLAYKLRNLATVCRDNGHKKEADAVNAASESIERKIPAARANLKDPPKES